MLATAEPTRWTVPLALFDWLRTIPAMRVQMLCVRLAALFWVLPQFPEIAEPTELVVDNVAFARSRTMPVIRDRKSTRLNSSHVKISYAVFCLKKKKQV